MTAKPTPAKKKTPAKRKPGRPSTYSQKIGDEICKRMSLGETLKKICESRSMPTQTAVASWRKSRPQFDVQFVRAREDQLLTWADDNIHLIDNAEMGYNVRVKLGSKEMEKIQADGYVTFRFRKHHLEHAKAMVHERKWLMTKLLPAVFGERLNIDANHTIEQKDDAEIIQEFNAEMEKHGLTMEDFVALVAGEMQ